MTLDEVARIRYEGSLIEKAKAYDATVDWFREALSRVGAERDALAQDPDKAARLARLETALAQAGYYRGGPIG